MARAEAPRKHVGPLCGVRGPCQAGVPQEGAQPLPARVATPRKPPDGGGQVSLRSGPSLPSAVQGAYSSPQHPPPEHRAPEPRTGGEALLPGPPGSSCPTRGGSHGHKFPETPSDPRTGRDVSPATRAPGPPPGVDSTQKGDKGFRSGAGLSQAWQPQEAIFGQRSFSACSPCPYHKHRLSPLLCRAGAPQDHSQQDAASSSALRARAPTPWAEGMAAPALPFLQGLGSGLQEGPADSEPLCPPQAHL